MSEKTATELYKEALASQKPEIVDVKAPSGFVFKFQQPSKFALLFGAGELPSYATSQAVEAWGKGGTNGTAEAAQNKLVEKVLSIRDKVLMLSYEPKLVVGAPQKENELSTDDVSNQDLEYLFKWVSAGGDVAIMAAMFPEGLGTGIGTGTNGSQLQRKTKRPRSGR